MGGFSAWHWIIVALVVLVLFGRGKISETMGDFGKGIKSFKKGLGEEETARQQTPPPPNNNTRIESRSERIVEREMPGRIFGVDPMVALIVGAVLVVVIVVGLVAMSRRTDDVHHTHHRV